MPSPVTEQMTGPGDPSAYRSVAAARATPGRAREGPAIAGRHARAVRS